MPDQFSKIELDDRDDFEFVVQAVKNYARALVPGLTGPDAGPGGKETTWIKEEVERAIEDWTTAAKVSMLPNLLLNGLDYADTDVNREAGQELEPFDEALSRRLQSLTEEADLYTARAIHERKTVPMERQRALQRRLEVEERIEARKRRRAEARRKMLEETAKEEEKGSAPKLERKAQVGKDLATALSHVDDLRIALPERRATAAGQHRVVQRLRHLPP